MSETTRKQLAFHAAAVILLGMLSGIPLAMSMLGYMDTHVDDWKLSHMEGLINGLLMLGIAAIGGLLTLSEKQSGILFVCLVFTGYSNALYGWVRGFSGHHGMDFAPPLSNQLAALLGGLPVVTAFIVIALVMAGSRKQ